MADEVPELPAASRAIAEMACEPLGTPVVCQVTAKGAAEAVPTSAPSTRKSTEATPIASLAAAVGGETGRLPWAAPPPLLVEPQYPSTQRSPWPQSASTSQTGPQRTQRSADTARPRRWGARMAALPYQGRRTASSAGWRMQRRGGNINDFIVYRAARKV